MSDYESVRGVVYDKPRALLRRYHDKGHEPSTQVLHAGFPFESSPTQGTRAQLSDGHVLAIPPLMLERKPVALNINEGFYHFCFQVDDVDAHQFIGERMGGYIENRQAVGKWESRVSVA